MSYSFYDKALQLGKCFVHHKQVPFDVGYRWGRTFLQEAFGLSSHQWTLTMFERYWHHEDLECWVEAFIVEHKPLSRSTQRRFFWNQYFTLNEATLDPRPETEGLVQLVLNEASGIHNILDLGTGSGCIVLSLLEALPWVQGVGVDIQEKALEAAQKNALILALDQRVQWISGNWYENLEQHGFKKNSFDVIISNPPYIASSQWSKLPLEVQRWDPKIALDGGEEGITPYKVIIPGAKEWLSAKGLLVLEIPAYSCTELLIFLGKKHFSKVSLVLDHFDRKRYLRMRS
ncbi:N5-glutamine methyltransferase family protein [Holospora curviuscula]|uniref:50S ribosomal protein L3 glutamine methyltransferase n=1 Tax=Holospora curviuscula TaxID=1082868 RepID=A0A2S5R9D4_9PROT|nr:peptide chain release factor N(5)-glutamine methyltransferase [Holospora curviuscula]PPE03812.1 50S ribosomal protein L3 glutamine methyltransferase [Holospora curviuscula]